VRSASAFFTAELTLVTTLIVYYAVEPVGPYHDSGTCWVESICAHLFELGADRHHDLLRAPRPSGPRAGGA
jgi:hypothetical protein